MYITIILNQSPTEVNYPKFFCGFVHIGYEFEIKSFSICISKEEVGGSR